MTIDNIRITLMIVAALLIRPTAFGQSFTTLGLVVVSVAFGLLIVDILRTGRVIISPQNMVVMLTTICLWSYLLVHALAVGSQNLEFVMKASVAHIFTVIFFSFLLSDPDTNHRFFRWLILILTTAAVSYVITVMMMMLVPLESLYLFQLPIEGYELSGDTFFPLTPLYGFMTVGALKLPRFLGWFREAGISQAFFIWAYFSSSSFGLGNKWVKTFLALGVLGSVSTAGIILLPATWGVAYLLKKKVTSAGDVIVKLFSSILILGITLFVTLYAPYIGIKDKFITHGTSFQDRINSTAYGLGQLIESPLGIGLYANDLHNSGINLLAMSHMIGVVGLVLALGVYFLPALATKAWKYYLIAFTPVFVTLLISQPLLDAPLVYVLLLANHSLSQRNSELARIEQGAA